MTAMSQDLIAFLRAWYEWANSGAPQGEPFSREFGLCTNADTFGGHRLGGQMADALDDCAYPFGVGDYLGRVRLKTQHECPKRLAWVRERLVEAGEAVS